MTELVEFIDRLHAAEFGDETLLVADMAALFVEWTDYRDDNSIIYPLIANALSGRLCDVGAALNLLKIIYPECVVMSAQETVPGTWCVDLKHPNHIGVFKCGFQPLPIAIVCSLVQAMMAEEEKTND